MVPDNFARNTPHGHEPGPMPALASPDGLIRPGFDAIEVQDQAPTRSLRMLHALSGSTKVRVLRTVESIFPD